MSDTPDRADTPRPEFVVPDFTLSYPVGTVLADAANKPTVYYLGNRAYRVGQGEPFTVSERQDCVLQAFIGCPVLDLPALAERSGLPAEAVPDVVSRLCKKHGFANAIKAPGGKGKGGYRANVIDGREKKG